MRLRRCRPRAFRYAQQKASEVAVVQGRQHVDQLPELPCEKSPEMVQDDGLEGREEGRACVYWGVRRMWSGLGRVGVERVRVRVQVWEGVRGP